jgi:anaerobic carbon-monoxide dehydrogenase iron sulfur subunit
VAKFIVVDETRCLACKQCVTECALAHSEAETLVEAVVDGASLQSRVHVEPAGEAAIPMQCRHCEDAPCMMVCPTEAISRCESDGPVLIDVDRCIGCRCCLLACPFGVIDMSAEGAAAVKCDLCIGRTTEGQEPACVAACPTKAIRYCELDDQTKARRRQAAQRLATDLGNDAETD